MNPAPAPLDFAYMRRSVDAAFDLVMRDRSAWSKFDMTAEGFYRSFAALLIVLPLNVITDVMYFQAHAAERIRLGKPALEHTYGFPDAMFWTVSLCIQWALFPLAMLLLVRFLNLTHRYAALIIAHNWGTVVVWLISLPPFLLHVAGAISLDLLTDLRVMILAFTLYYRFYIAQTALETNWSVAAAIAMLDFLLQTNFQFAQLQVLDLWLPSS